MNASLWPAQRIYGLALACSASIQVAGLFTNALFQSGEDAQKTVVPSDYTQRVRAGSSRDFEAAVPSPVGRRSRCARLENQRIRATRFALWLPVLPTD